MSEFTEQIARADGRYEAVMKMSKAILDCLPVVEMKQFTDCDNCRKPLTACECGINQMPVCNLCGQAQVECRCGAEFENAVLALEERDFQAFGR